MKLLRSILIAMAGVIHLMPLVGVTGGAQLARLYGVIVTDPTLLILLQHRAVLFALLGAFLVIAALVKAWQPAAIAAGLVSAVSFLGIAIWVGDFNTEMHRVVTADIMAIACLAVAAITLLLQWARRR